VKKSGGVICMVLLISLILVGCLSPQVDSKEKEIDDENGNALKKLVDTPLVDVPSTKPIDDSKPIENNSRVTMVDKIEPRDTTPEVELAETEIKLTTSGDVCVDLEGEKNYDFRGKTITMVGYKNNSYQDFCKSTSILEEYSCNGNELLLESYDCQTKNNATHEFSCKFGECILSATCEDVDNGLNYTQKSDIYVYNKTTTKVESQRDNCVGGISPSTLREWYCDNGVMDSKNYECLYLGEGYTCKDGACVMK